MTEPGTYPAVDATGEPVTVTVSAGKVTDKSPEGAPVAYVLERATDRPPTQPAPANSATEAF